MDTTFVNSSIDNQEILKIMLESQNNVYSNIIYVFIGVIAVLVGINIVFNFLNNKVLIKNEINRIFEEEKIRRKSEIEDMINKKYEEKSNEFNLEIDLLKGERARLFALTCPTSNTYRTNRVYWWIQALKYYLKSNRERIISVAINSIFEELKYFNDCEENERKEFCENFSKENNSDISIIQRVVDSAPELLFKEKREINEILKKLIPNNVIQSEE